MTVLEAAVLGLVQGLTEFLPISSTAHLRIVPALLGGADPGAAFSAVIQLGTTAAVVVYFWRDLVRLLRDFFGGLRARDPFGTPGARLAWAVGLGTIPIGVCGLVLKRYIEGPFRSLYVVAGALAVFAVLLWWAERRATQARAMDQLTLKDGWWVGLWQTLALIPGASRSGTTLTGALGRGLVRADAARFSFLLSIPATVLAGVFELRHFLQASDRPAWAPLAVGTAVAFASGMGAIAGLLRYLRTRTTLVFVGYRLLLGLLLFWLLRTGVLSPYSS